MALQDAPSYPTPGAPAATDVRRLANDSIYEVAHRFNMQDDHTFEFVCECGDLRCWAVVRMTLAEYREAPPGAVRGHR